MVPSPPSRWLLLSFLAVLAGMAVPRLPAQQPAPASAKAPEQPCDGDVWCGLFVARQADPGGAAPDPRNAALIEQLGKAFPSHRHFQLVGENSGSVYKEYECWIVPTKQLFLKVDSLGPNPERGGVHLHLQLWQQEHVLLKSDAILRRQPVFIAGPQWGDGRLIMVLKLASERKG